ncbi:MAG: hypothetical protein ACI87E_003641, partial [Mariniblastus sp.]
MEHDGQVHLIQNDSPGNFSPADLPEHSIFV